MNPVQVSWMAPKFAMAPPARPSWLGGSCLATNEVPHFSMPPIPLDLIIEMPVSAPPIDAFREQNRQLERDLAAQRDELHSLRAALTAAVAETVHARRDVLHAAERDVVELALSIAGRVLRRELPGATEACVLWAQEGLAALTGGGSVVVTLGKELLALVPAEAWREALGDATVREGDDVPPYGCRLRTADGHVEVGLESQLAAVASALGGDP